MRFAIFLFVATALLVGCATPHQRYLAAQQTQAAAARQAALNVRHEFERTIAADKRLDPIRDKVSLVDARDASLQMLSLKATPTAQEKRAIEAWYDDSKAEWPVAMGVVQRFWPWAVPIYEAERSAGLTLLAELYGGKLTYGEFNTRHLALNSKALQAVQARGAEIQREQLRAAQINAQVAAQQSMAASAAFSSFENYLIGQQLVNQQLQPTRITPFTCTQYGNRTNCY